MKERCQMSRCRFVLISKDTRNPETRFREHRRYTMTNTDSNNTAIILDSAESTVLPMVEIQDRGEYVIDDPRESQVVRGLLGPG